MQKPGKDDPQVGNKMQIQSTNFRKSWMRKILEIVTTLDTNLPKSYQILKKALPLLSYAVLMLIKLELD